MSYYGTKYYYRWITPTGRRRVNVQLLDYTGSATEVTPADPALEVEWGRPGGEDCYAPIMASEATLRVLGDSQGELLYETFDAAEREWRVQALVDPDGGTDYQMDWTGFLTGELWRDNPYDTGEVIELEAVDGITLLEEKAPALQAGEITLTEALMDVLYDLDLVGETGSALPLALSQEFYPLTDPPRTDQPLGFTSIDAAGVFTEGGDEARPVDLRTRLEDVLERFSMQLMQAGGTWHARQCHRIGSDGSLKVWTYDGPDDTTPQTSTANLKRCLPAARKEGSARPRSGVRRLSTLESVYTYDEMGELVDGGNFENGWGEWTRDEPDESTARRRSYDDTDLSVGATQDNTYVVELDAPGTETTSVPSISQTIPGEILDHGPEVDLTFSWDLAVGWASVGSRTRPTTKLKVGSYYLEAREAEVRQSALSAGEGKLYVEPIAEESEGRIIPKGQVLPVYATKTGNPQIATVTLSEPARAGDAVLKGQISSDIDLSEYDGPSESVRVVYWTWTTAETVIDDPDHLQAHPASDPMAPGEVSALTPQRISVPLRTPGGQLITGQPHVEFSMLYTLSSDNRVWIDGVSLQLTEEGEPIDETRFVATTGEGGRNLTIEHPMGEGPTKEHPRALRVDDAPGPIAGDWKIGPYAAGEEPSGTGLEELTATTQLRWQRYSLDRRTYALELREGDELLPHYVYEEDGTLYTVSYLRRSYGTAEETARAELTELRDGGTEGITQGWRIDASAASRGGRGGGGTYIIEGGAGGGGTVSWDDVLDKPSLVNTIGGLSGDVLLGDVFATDGQLLELAEGSITDAHLAYPLASVDIDGGAIDGTPIGQDTAANGRFATLTTTGRLGVGTSSPDSGIHLRGTGADSNFRLEEMSTSAGVNFELVRPDVLWKFSAPPNAGNIFRFQANMGGSWVTPLVLDPGNSSATFEGQIIAKRGTFPAIEAKRGILSTDDVISYEPASQPDGTFIALSTPRSDPGLSIALGDGEGDTEHQYDVRLLSGGDLLYNYRKTDEDVWRLGPTGTVTQYGDLVPNESYVHDLGTPTKKWRTASIGELRAAMMTVEEEATTTGGRLFVGFGNVLAEDFDAGDTEMVVEHNNILAGAVLKMESGGNFEFVRVHGYNIIGGSGTVDHFTIFLDTALGDVSDQFEPGDEIKIVFPDPTQQATRTVVHALFTGSRTEVTVEGSQSADAGAIVSKGTGPYTYFGVERDLDGTGANDWQAGDAIMNTGIEGGQFWSGTGFIDHYAVNSLLDGQPVAGPASAYMLRTGSAYNAVEPRTVVGNLNGWYGYSTDTFGFGAGDPSGRNIVVDPSEIAMRSGTTEYFKVDADSVTVGEVGRYHSFWGSDFMEFVNPDGDTLFSIEGTQVTLGTTSTTNHYLYASENRIVITGPGFTQLGKWEGSTITLGTPSSKHMTVQPSAIRFYDDSGSDIVAQWQGSEIQLGQATDEHVIINPSQGFRLFTAGGDVAAQASGDVLSIGDDFTYNAASNTLTIGGYATEDYADAVGDDAIDYLETTYPLATISEKATEQEIADALQDGTIISGGYINTTLLDVEDIFAQNVTVSAELEMGGSGVITNANNHFRIDDEGFVVRGGSSWRDPSAYSVTDASGNMIGGLGSTGGNFLTLRTMNGNNLEVTSSASMTLSAGVNAEINIGRGTTYMTWKTAYNVLALPRRTSHPPSPPSDEVYLYGLYSSEHNETQFWIKEADGSTARLI